MSDRLNENTAHQRFNRDDSWTTLITGSGKRIGREIALHLSGKGHRLVLHYNRSEDEANDLLQKILAMGREAMLYHCDFSNEAALLDMIPKVHAKFGQLTLLINNASVFEPSTIPRTSLDLLKRHFHTNFFAPFVLSQSFASHATKGLIINMLDTHITQNIATHTAYLLAKKTLAEFTKMAARSLAPSFRVNGIAPGYILPPSVFSSSENKTIVHIDEAIRVNRMQQVPLRRTSALRNVLRSIDFLIENDDITGHFIYIDGGEHLTPNSTSYPTPQ